jgi:hypothetical protein
MRKSALMCLAAAIILGLASIVFEAAAEECRSRATAALADATTLKQLAEVANSPDYRAAIALGQAEDASVALCLVSLIAFAILWRVAGGAPMLKLARAALIIAILLGLTAIGFGLARMPYSSRAAAAMGEKPDVKKTAAVTQSSDSRTAFLFQQLATVGGVCSLVSFVAAGSFWKGGRTRGLGRPATREPASNAK